jgi:hypothetical protein
MPLNMCPALHTHDQLQNLCHFCQQLESSCSIRDNMSVNSSV